MRDPWKYVAFPAAAVIGYLLSLVLTSQFQTFTGLSELASRLLVIAASALFAGFFVDEVIPAYIEKVEERRGAGNAGGDIGGDDFGGGEDFDLD